MNSRGLPDGIPAGAAFVCEYTLWVGIDTFPECAYLRRFGGTDEIWLANEYRVELAVSTPTADEPAIAARRLMDRSIRGAWAFQMPTAGLSSGLLSIGDLEKLVAAIREELDRNAEAALKGESRIVEIAQELGLCPEPAGTGPSHWRARCPGTNHFLDIEADAESFGCGWCKRKGREAELRAFVAERNR